MKRKRKREIDKQRESGEKRGKKRKRNIERWRVKIDRQRYVLKEKEIHRDRDGEKGDS